MPDVTKPIDDEVFSISQDEGIDVRLVGLVSNIDDGILVHLEFGDVDSLNQFSKIGAQFKETIAEIARPSGVKYQISVRNRSSFPVPEIFR